MDANLRVFKHLDNNGLNVYFPNSNQEEVKEPMVIVKDMGQYQQYGNREVGSTLIHLILHTTQDDYTQIIKLRDDVKTKMLDLKGFIRPTGFETPIINDDTKNSYTLSIEYEVKKRLFN